MRLLKNFFSDLVFKSCPALFLSILSLEGYVAVDLALAQTPPIELGASIDQQKAAQLVQKALDYWRDSSSHTVSEMTIHRPTWERSSTVVMWTRGRTHSLVRFTAPAKDAGNASLTVDREMWSFSPKINRVIKIPPSMKHQNWMGSDFSYEDLSKGDSIINDYVHSLITTSKVDGHTVYTINSVPKPEAPVVWGREVIVIRDDYLILEHQYFDQADKLVKKLESLEIGNLGGKLYSTKIRMENLEHPGEWTEVRTSEAKFGLDLSEVMFTLSNLANPRDDQR